MELLALVQLACDMHGEFKEFAIWFDTKSPGRSSPQRVDARWLIRGMLMFNDLDLVDDPWDYNLKKNR